MRNEFLFLDEKKIFKMLKKKKNQTVGIGSSSWFEHRTVGSTVPKIRTEAAHCGKASLIPSRLPRFHDLEP